MQSRTSSSSSTFLSRRSYLFKKPKSKYLLIIVATQQLVQKNRPLGLGSNPRLRPLGQVLGQLTLLVFGRESPGRRTAAGSGAPGLGTLFGGSRTCSSPRSETNGRPPVRRAVVADRRAEMLSSSLIIKISTIVLSFLSYTLMPSVIILLRYYLSPGWNLRNFKSTVLTIDTIQSIDEKSLQTSHATRCLSLHITSDCSWTKLVK